MVSKVENMIYKTDFDYEISEDEFPTTADSVLTQLIQENFYGKRKSLFRLLNYLKPYGGLVAGALIMGILGAGISLIFPGW